MVLPNLERKFCNREIIARAMNTRGILSGGLFNFRGIGPPTRVCIIVKSDFSFPEEASLWVHNVGGSERIAIKLF